MKRLISFCTDILTWVRRHLLISIGIVIVIGVVLWGIGPVSFAATHMSMRNCGKLYEAYDPGTKPDNPATQQVIQCFVQAHQQCEAASLSYSEHGTDTGSTTTFYTANKLGNCAVSGQDDSFVDVMPNRTTNFTCSGIASKPDGLHFLSCSNTTEDIIIPFHALKA